MQHKDTTDWHQSAQYGRYVEVWTTNRCDDIQVHLTGKPDSHQLQNLEHLLHGMGYRKNDSHYDLDNNRFVDTYRRVEPQERHRFMVGS